MTTLPTGGPAETQAEYSERMALVFKTKLEGDRLRLMANMEPLRAALLAAGGAKLAITYSGSGDEGEIDSVTVQNENGTPLEIAGLPPLEMTSMASASYHAEKGWVENSAAEVAMMGVQQACELVCNDWLQIEGHGGYECDDGGQGKISLDLLSGAALFEHQDRYTEYQEDLVTLKLGDPLSVVQAPPPYVKKPEFNLREVHTLRLALDNLQVSEKLIRAAYEDQGLARLSFPEMQVLRAKLE